MNSRYNNLFRFFFVCIDLLALNTVYFSLVLNMNRIPPGAEHQYMVLFMAANMAWLLTSYSTALYVDNTSLDVERFAKRTAKTLIPFVVVMLVFIFVYHYSYSRLFVFMGFAAFSSTLFLSRTFLLAASFYRQKHNKINKRVIIIGYNSVAKRLASSFRDRERSLSVDGYFEDPREIHELTNLPIIGNIDESVSYAIKNRVSEIYST